jgi:hypothetical protein
MLVLPTWLPYINRAGYNHAISLLYPDVLRAVVARVGLLQVSNRGPTGYQGDLKLTGPGARPGGGGGGGGGAKAPEALLTLSACH